MRRLFALAVLALLAVTVPAHAQKTFRNRRAVDVDAALRLMQKTGSAPAADNTITFEGNVAEVFTSTGGWGAITVSSNQVRFECDTNAYSLGCYDLAASDHVRVYAHLRSYLSARHDGPDVEAVVNLIYRRTTSQCGDLTCTTWTLLGH